MRRIPRSDNNHNEIVRALRAAGASVFSTAMVGCGFPDLSVGYKGQNYFLEVKNGRAKQTDDELTFQYTWNGRSCRNE